MHYQVVDQLQQFKAKLLDSVTLSSGMQLAKWHNQHDQVSVCSNHHTLSLYVHGGYQSYLKTAQGWHNGGGPDHFCLMPKHAETTWDLRDPLTFVHLYYTEQHLHQIAEQIWDKEPRHIELNQQAFVSDPQISMLYHHYLLQSAWHNKENHLEISTATTLLLNHLLKKYSNVQWQAPEVKGGLAPYTLKRVLAWIDAHLNQAITLADLAQQAALSEYHFAHMFKQSMGLAPHQYVMQHRLRLAHQAILTQSQSLSQIALDYGFSSSSHFSHRFKKHFGYTPSQLKAD
ncbi:AraC family transcriptional regulator [Acinetobacter calcoaceticus]|uniref:AraC family transcriptional regulator n=1 Tax=Acinetobacter calcoaceticus TaxID=471 RepID=A0A4R1Y0Y1_ACICA|nr:AraC family transcriptional regulator [Acinetobacter calcoaceticus]